jgi:hypothetical protein
LKYTTYSYRHAQEILENVRYQQALNEVTSVVSECPLFIWPNKSKNARLDVVQQLLNTFFERRLAVDHHWDLHPNATAIAGSKLSADFRKTFGTGDIALTVQAEVQFGNMSRWYSDVFKFQAGYSGQRVRLGISVVPVQSLAVRIDSNVANFERVRRELPAAELSITLPILTLGIEPDPSTTTFDVSQTQFTRLREITGRGNADNRWRVVNGFLQGLQPQQIGPTSSIGPRLQPLTPDAEDEDSEED